MTLALWLLLVCAVLVIFWKLLCLWWRRRQMLLSEDASSDISHLPLPPGDTGLPILGETLEWLVEVRGKRGRSIALYLGICCNAL